MSYDPTIGRWTAEDPIAFEGADANLYRYVGNHPTNATDPTGMAEKTNPSWWDLYPQYLNPFSSLQPSVDWWDTSLKIGKGGAAVTGVVCSVAAGGAAIVGFNPVLWGGGAAVAGGAGLGIGTTAVVGPGLGAGTYPALLIDGVVYVHRFHVLAAELAGGASACGTVQKYGMAVIDATGKVIEWL